MIWGLKKPASALAVLAGILTMTGNARADQQVVVGTLEWPPYVGAKLPDQGATAKVLTEALKGSGYTATFKYLPWKRDVDAVAGGSSDMIAFFPGYFCKQKPGLIGSASLGDAPLGIAEPVAKPIAWNSVDDLKGKRIGVVLGYSNGAAFDAAAKAGTLTTDTAASDAINLRKLAAGRVDGAVVDAMLFKYMLATDPELKPDAGKLEMNKKPLVEQTLHVCAHDDAKGQAFIAAVNKGLAKVNADAVMQAYFKSAF